MALMLTDPFMALTVTEIYACCPIHRLAFCDGFESMQGIIPLFEAMIIWMFLSKLLLGTILSLKMRPLYAQILESFQSTSPLSNVINEFTDTQCITDTLIAIVICKEVM